MGDIDILVHPKDWDTSHDIAKYDIHIIISGKGDTAKRIDVKKLWEDAVSFYVAGLDTLQLCPEHQLLHLIVHGDYFRMLKWLCDIAELVRHYQDNINWQSIPIIFQWHDKFFLLTDALILYL